MSSDNGLHRGGYQYVRVEAPDSAIQIADVGESSGSGTLTKGAVQTHRLPSESSAFPARFTSENNPINIGRLDVDRCASKHASEL